jgi:hypothetical protein
VYFEFASPVKTHIYTSPARLKAGLSISKPKMGNGALKHMHNITEKFHLAPATQSTKRPISTTKIKISPLKA